MQVELIIRADSMAEIAHLFVAPSGGRPELPAFEQRVSEPKARGHTEEEAARSATAKEVEPEAESPKPRRGRAAAAKKETEESAQPQVAEGTGAAQSALPPSDEKVTLDDIRNKASALMDAGKQTGAEIQKVLVDKFGARAFGQLKPEQYADVIGELNNLG